MYFAYTAYNILEVTSTKSMIVVAAFILYAIIFSLLGNDKIIIYIEWILVLLGIFLLKEQFGNMLFVLMMVPIVKIISNKLNSFENIMLSVSVFLFSYLSGMNLLISLLISISFLLFLVTLSFNFKKIGVIEKENGELKKENLDLMYETSKKNNQVDIISKLFYRKKRLEEIKKIREIIEEIVETSNQLYNSDFSVLYQFKNGIYTKVLAKGKFENENIPETISMDKGKNTTLTKKKMIIPIEYEKKAWGLLVINGKKTQLTEDGRKADIDFESSDLEIIYLYLESALARLKEIKLTEQLTEAAFYDRLTSIPNRAFLEQDLLDEKIAEMRETKKPFGVLIVDIDSFKSFNDTFGHIVGDEVLKIVSKIAEKSLVDEKDKFGRWGGEEFVAYLTGTPQEIKDKAELIRENIHNYNFSYRKITISGGIAFFGKDGRTLKDVIENADKALYQSKEEGKNKITMFHMMNK
jgi:diguanylate cyclase (GGDEF)-like protein